MTTYELSSSKPGFRDLRKDYSKLWLFITGTSAIFLVLCILAARFYPAASNLVTFGLVYITLLLLGFIFWSGDWAEGPVVGNNFWTPFILSLIVFFGVSYLFAGLTKNFSLITWSLIPTNSLFPTAGSTVAQAILTPVLPGTIHLSTLHLSTAQAQTGLALFFNIPGPFAEEMGFRVFMWKVASPLIGNKLAIIFQAVGFGVLHYFAYGANIPNIVLAVTVGALIGIIYAKWQNELSVGLSHFGFNISSLLIAVALGATLPI